MSVGSLAVSVRPPPGHVAANLDTTSSKVASLDPDLEATSAARTGVWTAVSSTEVLTGSSRRATVGGGAGEVFVVEAFFFWAGRSELRALAALASTAGILKRDGGVEGWRVGALALDPVGAGVGVFEGAGGGMGLDPTRRDPDLVLAAGVGEGTGEERGSRVVSFAPEEGRDPATIGEADTARREDVQ